MRSFFKAIFLSLILIIFSTGCQYRFGRGELSQSYSTFSIPYIEGDQKGGLTAEVIKKISASGALSYVASGGDLTLNIKLVDWGEENIDFRYDRKRSGKLKKSLIPTETRVSTMAEVLLVETYSKKVIRGPTRITATTEFDHTYYATEDEINVFSLGQLNDVDAAKDSVIVPLNRLLADRIADYIVNSW